MADDQPVHVVAAESKVNAKASVQRLAFVGDSVIVCVGQSKQVRDAGVVNLVAVREHPRAGAHVDAVEVVGENF